MASLSNGLNIGEAVGRAHLRDYRSLQLRQEVKRVVARGNHHIGFGIEGNEFNPRQHF